MLLESFRRELLQFYNSYYSANQMTLAIVGRDSLDTLEKVCPQNKTKNY
jgi:secreted Zn-dependent insulinase-like peptidase